MPNLFIFQNIKSLAVGIGLLIFIVIYTALMKLHGFRGNKALALIISLTVAFIAGWKLYSERFYGWEANLAVVLVIIIVVIVFRIFWAFVRNAKRSFRN